MLPASLHHILPIKHLGYVRVQHAMPERFTSQNSIYAPKLFLLLCCLNLETYIYNMLIILYRLGLGCACLPMKTTKQLYYQVSGI